MLGIEVDLVPCDQTTGFLPDLGALKEALTPKVRVLALVSPNNPTGAIYPPELLAEIFALCKANGTWLVLDETYRDFLPGGTAPHALFSQAGWEETLIGLYSFSKSFCIPGHRLGAITASPAAVAEIAKVMDNVQICAPRAGQIALEKALPALDDWRAANREEIVRRAEALKAVMADVPDWSIQAIGAYFAYIRHPYPDIDSAFVAEKLAKRAGIICLPGDFFGAGQDAYLRFAFANAGVEVIEQLRERLKGFVLPGI